MNRLWKQGNYWWEWKDEKVFYKGQWYDFQCRNDVSTKWTANMAPDWGNIERNMNGFGYIEIVSVNVTVKINEPVNFIPIELVIGGRHKCACPSIDLANNGCKCGGV